MRPTYGSCAAMGDLVNVTSRLRCITQVIWRIPSSITGSIVTSVIVFL